MWETQVRTLDWEGPLEKEVATYSSILAWRIPWTEKPGRLQSMGSQRVRYDWAITHTTQPAQFLGFSVAVVFSAPVMSDSSRPQGLQHARLPCPSPPSEVCSSSCLLSWRHPTISSSVTPFSSPLQSFPGSGSFPMSQLFASGSQSTVVSASTSVLPMNIGNFRLA